MDTSVIFAMATLCPAFRAMSLQDRAVPTPSVKRRATEEPDGVVLCSAGRQSRRRERASRDERFGERQTIKAPTRPNSRPKRKRSPCRKNPAQSEAHATAVFLGTDMRQTYGAGAKLEQQDLRTNKRNRLN